ncbi:MAG: EAL domain-containing protein [Gemmatimonadaceae bacterium]|nr:EAL domain-containing protein [Gemmatimonadaceae bacterium]
MTASLLTRRFVIAQFVCAMMFGVAMLANWPGQAAREVALNVVYLVIGAPTLWALYEASRDAEVDEEHRRAWCGLMWATGAWWAGDAIWALIAFATGERPPLSVADLAYLAFSPLALRALARFPGLGSTTAERWRVQMDAVVAAITMGTVFYWVSPLESAPDSLTHWLSDAVNIAYPLSDIMLLTGAIVLWSRQTNVRSVTIIKLITAAIAVKTLADVLYARAVIADEHLVSMITDSGWIGWYAFVTLAAIKARDLTNTSMPEESRAPRMAWLPYASIALVGVLFVDLVQREQFAPARGVAIGMLSLLVVILVRQAVVNTEINRLDKLAVGLEAESRLAALVNHASDLIMILDVDSTIRFVSPSAQRILGMTPEQLVSTDGLGLLHDDDVDNAQLLLGRLLQHPSAQETFVCRVQHGGGGWRWMEVVCTNHVGTDSINGLVINLRDVTERRELEGKLEWQAFHDPMTGLANRVLFSDRVGHALERRQRNGMELGVLFIDLDHFKIVNDTLGHAAGDALLREAARRIQGAVRGADTVARLGGDEFAVLLEDASAKECIETGERLLHQLTRAFTIEGREVFTGASIGVTVAELGVSLDDLVRDADVAMYVAKGEGRGRVVVFEASMREQVAERLHLEADLRRALEQNDLQVHYQPQFDLRTGEVLGAEALVRWMHPIRGMIPPSRFVPIAEQAGLMVEMSRFILNAACRDAAGWRQPNGAVADLHVSVNLSGRHLQDPGVVQDVATALTDSGLDPALLTVEITESVMMHNTQAAIGVLRELKGLGITIAIDDFGAGYSSLSYLQQFPIDILKIDKAFVDKLGTADSDEALARAILALGDALGLATVAEGIETMRQVEMLQQLGCLLGQGFLFSRPLAARAFADMLVTGGLEPLAGDVLSLTDRTTHAA